MQPCEHHDAFLTPETVRWACRIMLQREPVSRNEVENLMRFKTLSLLSGYLLDSNEYKNNFFLHNANKQSCFINKPQIIFLHIEKNCGRSFHKILQSNYECVFSRVFNEKIVRSSAPLSRVTAIAGHISFNEIVKKSSSSLFLSIVRHPCDRAFSQHKYWATCKECEPVEAGGERNYPWYFNANSLMDTILNGGPIYAYLHNHQCRRIAGQPSFDAVLETLDKENFIVGCFDYPQEFVNTCARLLEWKFWSLPRINVANDRNYKEKFLSEPGLFEYIMEHNQEDMKLYNYIKSNVVVNTIKSNFDITPLMSRCFSK